MINFKQNNDAIIKFLSWKSFFKPSELDNLEEVKIGSYKSVP